jgi:photosystem II stability/assembly factor-like uncharacterized protein
MGEEGVFRSTNMGELWESKNDGLHSGSWMNVHSMVRSGNLLFAATDFGVYRSSNNGDYWYPSTGTSGFLPVFSLAVSNGVLFAGREGTGVFLSNDNGNTWNAVNTGMPHNASGYIQRINKLFVDGENVYVGTNGSGVYRSSNYGNMWMAETTGLKKMDNGFFFPTYSLAKVGSYIFAGTQDDGIYRLTGIGSSWTKVTTGLPPDAYVTSISGRGDHIFAATHGSGLYYSSSPDSIAWLSLFTVFPGKVDVGIVGSSGSNLFLSASSGYYNGAISGVFRSPNIGNTWLRDSVLSRIYISSFQSYGDSFYTVGGSLFFSSDNGNNWIGIDSSLFDPNALIKSNDTLFVGWGYDNWQWGERGAVFLSPNNGKSWSERWRADTTVLALAKIGNNLFAGGLHGVFRSTNTGLNWIAVNNGLPSNVEVYGFSTIEGNLFALTSNGIYLSTNNGDSWFGVNNGLPIDTSGNSGPIHLLARNNRLFAGTKNGVYISTNMGESWTSVDNGLNGDALYIQSLAMLGNDLLVATKDGLWRRPLSEIVSVKNRNDIFPQEFYLYQNYPNPFNPSTTIRYGLPNRSSVRIVITNTLGQQVAVLENGEREAGYHEVEWNANVATGIYFYRIVAISTTNPNNHFVQVKKMLLLK